MSDTALMTLQETMSLGTVLVKSGYFKDARDEAQAVVKVLAGREMGFGPIASMQGINIIQGQPSVGANLLGAAIKRTNKYNYRVVGELTNDRAEIAFYENGQEVGRSVFTMDDADRAGLTNKQNWKQFPRNMLFARALSNGARWYCPDVFGGVSAYTPEELGAPVDENGDIIDVTPTPAGPDNGDEPPLVQREPEPKAANGKPKVANINSKRWGKAAAEFAAVTPYYMKGDQVDWYHLTGAAAKLGFSEITDDNLNDVLDALRTYANEQTGQQELPL